jgi:hypothetical protein
MRWSFAGGGTFGTTTYWFKGGFSMCDPDGIDPDEAWPTHNVMLTPPMPPQMQEMIHFLDRNDDRVLGTVLLLTPDAVRYEQDRSLIAE